MTTVTAKLNKSPMIKPMANGGNMYVFTLGKQEYNFRTKQKEWVNYSVALFGKDSQKAFYDTAIVQGSIVSISCSGIIPQIWGDNNDKVTLDMIEPKLVYVNQGATEYGQQASSNITKQAPPPGFDDFDDDDIPF